MITASGSPPHTWRKLDRNLFLYPSARITSTYVEKTHWVHSLNWFNEDHLHIRGENYNIGDDDTQLPGSPPHTWRKLVVIACQKLISRITSTYVEKTFLLQSVPFSTRDHLHIRGENKRSIPRSCIWVGSPPHTWRKPKSIKEATLGIRITSTYVEKTVIALLMHQLV